VNWSTPPTDRQPHGASGEYAAGISEPQGTNLEQRELPFSQFHKQIKLMMSLFKPE